VHSLKVAVLSDSQAAKMSFFGSLPKHPASCPSLDEGISPVNIHFVNISMHYKDVMLGIFDLSNEKYCQSVRDDFLKEIDAVFFLVKDKNSMFIIETRMLLDVRSVKYVFVGQPPEGYLPEKQISNWAEGLKLNFVSNGSLSGQKAAMNVLEAITEVCLSSSSSVGA
jgi:hypothetical protein